MRKFAKLRRDPLAYMLDSRWLLLRLLGAAWRRYERKTFMRRGAKASTEQVDVIMTSYNTADHLEGAIRSVLGQSHQHFTLWVVDDASTDDSAEILARLAGEDSRIRAYQMPHNCGTYCCKNWALQQSHARYVTFHDSDDVSHAHRLQMQLGALQAHKKRVAVTCQWQRVTDSGADVCVDGRMDRLALISLMIKREVVLPVIGYFDSVTIAADSECLSRLRHVFGVSSIKHMRHVLYTGLLRADSLTRAAGSGMTWTNSETGHETRQIGGHRRAYRDAYQDWHRHTEKLFIDFPQKTRPFAVDEVMAAAMAAPPTAIDPQSVDPKQSDI